MIDESNKMSRPRNKTFEFSEYDDINDDNIYGLLAIEHNGQNGGALFYKNQYYINKLDYMFLLNINGSNSS